MAIKEVCRLCLTTDDLVWVFDKRFESNNNMKDVVFITTGVEITAKDIISQKICKKCCQVTIKMFEFRRTSLKNDQDLRERCKLILKDKELKIPNTQVTIRNDGKKPKIRENIPDAKKVALEVRQETKPLYKIHPSVRELFKTYPQIKLPTVCLSYDISPSVSMMMDQVEQYFESHKIDFQEHSKLALRAGNIATKKTSSLLKNKNLCFPKANVTSKIIKNERKDKLPKLEVKTNIGPSVSDKNSNKIIDYKDSDKSSNKIAGRKDSKIRSVDKDKLKIHPEIKEDGKTPCKNLPFETKAAVEDERVPSNKRKFSECDTSEKKELKKTNFVESLGLTSKMDGDNQGGASYITNKTHPVHICEICNSVQYSAKDLRKHQNKHLRCQFCKVKFRSLDSKKEHLDKACPIKNMMNNLPEIKLQKVDHNEWVRSRYPEVFQDFLTPNILVIKSDIHSEQDESVPKQTVVSESCEIIEILSDDEDCLPSSNVNAQVFPSKQTSHVVSAGESENVVYNTVSIVRPDIKIKGSNALDLIDARLTDIKVLKELLTLYRPAHLFVDKTVQTEVPVTETISVNFIDMSAELKELKPQLHVYKIPVVMKKGNFGVRYTYSSEKKVHKKLCLWDDLTAIDIKRPTTKVIPSSTPIVAANSNGISVFPSTATYNTPGSTSRPSQQVTPTTSKFIRVNANSLSPITTGIYSPPSISLIDTNPMLNNFLQNAPLVTQTTTSTLLVAQTTTASAQVAQTTTVTPQIAQTTTISPVTQTTTTPSVTQTTTIPQVTQTTMTPNVVTSAQTLNTETPVSNTVPQFGIIRVKNVWELT